MGAKAGGLGGKLVKIVLLCGVIYALLYGFQEVMDFLYVQTDQLKPWWQLHRLRWIKYPLFAIVIYMVMSEKI